MATRQVPTWNDKEEPDNVMSAKTRFFWLCLLLVQLVGCRGCTQQKKEELAKDGTKKEKLNRLTADDVRALPFSEDSTGAADLALFEAVPRDRLSLAIGIKATASLRRTTTTSR